MNDRPSPRPGPGVHLHRSPDAAALAAGFVASLGGPVADPFARPLVLVPGAGMQRWLSQQVARLTASDGQGVSAGLLFEPMGRLEALLGQTQHRDDPWAPERLVWRILDLAEPGGDPGLGPLSRHLAANDQRYANALRIAGLFARYAAPRPDELRRWSASERPEDLGLGFDAWQATLWRRLHDTIEAPDPVRRREALADGLGSGAVPAPWPSVAVFAPRRVTVADAELLRALGSRVRVDVWLVAAGPDGPAASLATTLGRRGRATASALAAVADTDEQLPRPARPGTALGRLQAAVDADAPARAGAPDASVSIHASHGPERQVEVLREVLVGVLADDPTLEPRDIVVACPDVSVLSPHLTAAFAPADLVAGDAWEHPGRRIRVQLTGRPASESNLLYGLLRDLVQFGATRATAGQLLDLCAHPFVARRFGFGTDDLERLEELAPAAAIRWGINPAHRATFGLGGVQQNTWQLGVQRLVMGEAFSADDLASAGVVATVDDVTSTDTSLVGALAELVSRVSRIVARCAAPATVGEWVDRFRAMIDLMADVPFAEAWQASQVWSVLDAIQGRGEVSAVPLGRADAVALLDAGFADRTGRPAFGNGSLVVCGLDALAQVPHRVVCLVGLDERSFPRRQIGDGDDLLARRPAPGDPDVGADDRQALLDALMAARERLVVIYQGRSSLTNEVFPPPSGVVDLIEAAAVASGLDPEDAVAHEPLQPFAPASFAAEAPRSFDLAGLRAARALTEPRRPAPDRYGVGHLHSRGPVASLDLDTLAAFLRHPARYLLRQRAGLTFGDDAPLAEELPLELNALEEWSVGDRVLGKLLAGHRPDAVVHAEWLSGLLPPHRLGSVPLSRARTKAERVFDDFQRAAGGEPVTHVIDLDVGGVRVTGRVTSRGGRVVTAQYSRVQPRSTAEAWVRQLALSAQLERRVDAVIVGARGPVQLKAPPVDLAAGFLGDLVDLAVQGQERVLIMPPRVACRWAEARLLGRDPLEDRAVLNRDWKFERDETWDHYLRRGERPWDRVRGADLWGHPEERSELGALAALVWQPIVRSQG